MTIYAESMKIILCQYNKARTPECNKARTPEYNKARTLEYNKARTLEQQRELCGNLLVCKINDKEYHRNWTASEASTAEVSLKLLEIPWSS